MTVERFGNAQQPLLRRTKILRRLEEDFSSLIGDRCPSNMFDHAMPLVSADDLEFADDGIGPSLSFGHLNTLALDHLGGSPGGNDIALFMGLPPSGAASRPPGRDGKSTRPHRSPRYHRFESAFLQR
jgi:hypothetical protein